MTGLLNGQVALVTGSTAGIGRGIALGLAASGARIVLHGRTADRVRGVAAEVAAINGADAVHSVIADLGDQAGVETLAVEALERFGRVDILVNNAGEPAHRPFLDNDMATWRRDFDVKFFAAVALARALVPAMRRNGGGCIFQILNRAARVPNAGTSPTAMARAAGMSLTKLLANEFAADNVRSIGLVLGIMKSDQWVRAWQASASDQPLERFYDDMAAKVPLGRIGEPAELAELIAFLASAKGSYVTGTTINFDGGMSSVL